MQPVHYYFAFAVTLFIGSLYLFAGKKTDGTRNYRNGYVISNAVMLAFSFAKLLEGLPESTDNNLVYYFIALVVLSSAVQMVSNIIAWRRNGSPIAE